MNMMGVALCLVKSASIRCRSLGALWHARWQKGHLLLNGRAYWSIRVKYQLLIRRPGLALAQVSLAWSEREVDEKIRSCFGWRARILAILHNSFMIPYQDQPRQFCSYSTRRKS
jgi:hypothetical protein